MVRRRTRACASSKAPVMETLANGDSSAEALSSAAAQLLDDQYFASPKRKDCKIEESFACEDSNSGSNSPSTTPDAEEAIALKSKLKSSSPNKMKGERCSPTGGRTIGVPLATRSQTRTIENFFKAKQNKMTGNNMVECGTTETANKIIQPTLSASVTPPQMTQVQLQHIEQQKQQINGDHNYQQQSPPPPIATINRHSLDHVVVPQEFIFDLSEDTNDSERTDLSEEAPAAMAMGLDHAAIAAAAAALMANGFDFTTHRSAQRADSHSSSHSSSNTSATENIFLQEPVLTLNVDKSPNQASSIKINKTLEVEPKFSSPTSLTASVLHGRFNQIQLTSPSKRDSFGYEKKPLELSCHDYALLMLPENDNSSCDSGVAFHTTVTTTSNNNALQCNGSAPDNSTVQASAAPVAAAKSRRKPATPHRILCPSPIKAPPRVTSPTGSPSTRKMASALSPRKSQRHLNTTVIAAANGGALGVPAPNKTRRRLNPSPNKEQQQAALVDQGNRVPMANGEDEDAIIVLVDDDVDVDEEDDDDHDLECENMASNVTGMKLTGAQSLLPPLNGVTKSILNSAKHPTNQQNATNNKGQKLKSQHKTKYTVQRPPQVALKHQGPQPLAATNGNREMNDFFPVRRSVRKTKTVVKEEMMRNLEQAILEERCEGLKVAHFEGKGRGIIAERRFQRGEFVIEYEGDLISTTEAAEREKRYALDENAGCYMYYFKHKNQQYCIDATEDTGKLGRLVNHSRTGNLMTKVVVVKQKPHLVLIAKDDIEAGEELCYDYGDRSKESLLHHPWLAF